MIICRICGKEKDSSEFSVNLRSKSGYDARCRTCRSERTKELYQIKMAENLSPIQNGTLVCTLCKTEKDVRQFDVQRNRASGRSSHCKECHKGYYKKRHASGELAGGKSGWNRLRHSAKSRGLVFSIKLSDFSQWWSKTDHVCHYCGSTTDDFILAKNAILDGQQNLSRFREIFRNPVHRSVVHLSVDRKDPDVGYELDNLAKACWICNYIKGGILKEVDMLMVAPSIRRSIIEAIQHKPD